MIAKIIVLTYSLWTFDIFIEGSGKYDVKNLNNEIKI
jgi:hypothetical protein